MCAFTMFEGFAFDLGESLSQVFQALDGPHTILFGLMIPE